MLKICSIILVVIYSFSSAAATLETPPKETDTPENAVYSPARFPVCSAHSCQQKDWVSLNETEWQQVKQQFLPPASTPLRERGNIIKAIRQMEKLVGEKTKTQNDAPMTAYSGARTGQMDCYDEAKNTATYVQILINEGLVRLHKLDGRVRRGFFFGGWPHTAAVLTERFGKERFVIDSWFLKNGKAPYILPVSTWKAGWHPPKNVMEAP